MAKRAPNPNTAYGRKRLREEHQQWRANLSPQERADIDRFSYGWTIVLIIVILVIMFFALGPEKFGQWLAK